MCVYVCVPGKDFCCLLQQCLQRKKGHAHTFCDVFMCLWDKKKFMTAVSVHICQFIFHL